MQQLLPVGSGHKQGSDRGRSQCLAEGVVIGPGETSLKHLFPLCCHKGTCDVIKSNSVKNRAETFCKTEAKSSDLESLTEH